LKGHNGKVKQVIWSNDDAKIVSCGMDGGKKDLFWLEKKLL